MDSFALMSSSRYGYHSADSWDGDDGMGSIQIDSASTHRPARPPTGRLWMNRLMQCQKSACKRVQSRGAQEIIADSFNKASEYLCGRILVSDVGFKTREIQRWSVSHDNRMWMKYSTVFFKRMVYRSLTTYEMTGLCSEPAGLRLNLCRAFCSGL